jgi:hypothetical protein
VRPLKGIFCDDISEFESTPATQSGLPELGWKTLADIWRADLTEFAELAEEVDPHVFKLRARRQSQHSPRAGGGSKESPGCAEAFKEADRFGLGRTLPRRSQINLSRTSREALRR